jgi:DNA-binding SARP family transcriptional activator
LLLNVHEYREPADKSLTGVQARLAEEAGVQARLTKKASKETMISQDPNDWILVTKTRRQRMPKQQESKVMKIRKVSTKTKRDALTEALLK